MARVASLPKLDSLTGRLGASALRVVGTVLAVVGGAFLLIGGYLAWSSYQTRVALEQAEAGARTQAQRLEGQIGRIRAALSSDELAAAIGNGPDNGAPDRAKLIGALRARDVRNVLNIVVAREAIETVDLGAFPGSGFAALEMLLRARDDGEVPVQVHFAGTPDEYLAAARRVVPDDPASPVVLATFPVGVLVNQIEIPETVAGLRLVQRTDETRSVIDEFGRGALGAPNATIPIADSLLELAWYRSSTLPPLNAMQLAGVTGAGVLGVLLGLVLVRRASRRRVGAVDAGDAPAEPAPAERPGRQFSRDATHALSPDDPALGDVPEAALEAPEAAKKAAGPPEAAPRSEPSDDGRDELPDLLVPDVDVEPEEEDAPLTPDGESRREAAEQQSLDAPELGGRPDSRAGPPAHSESTDPTAELDFDPDAPADDQGEISMMLQSLVEEEQTGDASDTDDASDAAPQPEPVAHVVPTASIFRAYDIRGVVGKTLDAQVARAIGLAVGSEGRTRGLTRIAVARDGRLSGAELLAALSEGLVATGMDVVDVGAVPTPVLYYAAQEIGGGSGVMVTGSHNPPDYNGFKIVLGGETLYGETIEALHRRLEDDDLVRGDGRVTEQRIAVQYIERIGTDIQLEKPLKVVADCGNGIAGSIAPRLLDAIGAEVIPLYAEVDGTFPNHHPDPGDPATLEDLKLCVRNFNADLGVAFDGDGDRLGVVAPGGEIIYADRLMMLFARDVLGRVPGAPIIFDVKCSSLLPKEIEAAGGKPVMSRTGHSFLKERLKREQSPLAGEMSGHFFFGERWYGFDDGLYAAARLLEILAADNRAPAQILATLPKAESTPEIKVEMNEGEAHPFVEAFQANAVFEDAEIRTLDGVRADFADGFGLLRASNTTPVLVLRFEGVDKKALARIQNQFREAMLAINPSLKLPF